MPQLVERWGPAGLQSQPQGCRPEELAELGQAEVEDEIARVLENFLMARSVVARCCCPGKSSGTVSS